MWWNNLSLAGCLNEEIKKTTEQAAKIPQVTHKVVTPASEIFTTPGRGDGTVGEGKSERKKLDRWSVYFVSIRFEWNEAYDLEMGEWSYP